MLTHACGFAGHLPWSVADLLESQMLASETGPISYPGVAFEDEVAEPCFTNMGRLVEKARIVGQAYEKHRCFTLDVPLVPVPAVAGGGDTAAAAAAAAAAICQPAAARG